MLKWLVIGIGDITTKRVIPALLEEKRSELWEIVTRDPAKAAPYGVRAFTDLDAAMAAGGADAVYVASPVFLHAPQALASLRAGKQVLCEKPMAMNYAEAKSMVDAARAAGKTLGVAYYRRAYPKVGRAKELNREGRLGNRCSLTSPARIGARARGQSGRGSWIPFRWAADRYLTLA